MKRASVTFASVAVIVMTMSGAASERNPITKGDVRANFQAIANGGAVIRSNKGFETTIPPANAVIHSIRPLPFWDGLHYCELDWHAIAITDFASKGGAFDTAREARKALNGERVTFELDDVLLPAEEATAVKAATGTRGDTFWRAFGIFYPPGALPIGTHSLTGFGTRADGSVVDFPEIDFHIDPAGAGTCL